MIALRPSFKRKNPSHCGRSALLAMACFLGALSLATEPSHAAHSGDHGAANSKQEMVTTLAARDPETTGSIVQDESDGLNCNQSRKRLWVEGEGWIVRKVTTCY